VGIKEVSAHELQVEEVEALAHQHVEELQVLVVATVHLPGQGDVDAAVFSVFESGGLQHHGLWVAHGRVQNHSIKEVATLEALLLEHGLSSVRPVLLGSEVHVVLVQNAVGHLAQFEVVGHQLNRLPSGACW
jgi:hypothetical protein